MLHTDLPLHIAKLATIDIANWNALYPSPADQLRCTDNQCFMMNYSTGVSAQQSVIIVLQTPDSHCIWGGGHLSVGEKGSSKDKEVQKKLSDLSKLPNSVKLSLVSYGTMDLRKEGGEVVQVEGL